MKPRILRSLERYPHYPQVVVWTWVCKLRGTSNGYGLSPKYAYDEWKRRNRLC
jgi:hypothetical protein